MPGLHLLPNPATFSIDSTVFGVVTSDIVRHLSGAEVKLGAASADRISCLVAHLLAQHRCKPLHVRRCCTQQPYPDGMLRLSS